MAVLIAAILLPSAAIAASFSDNDGHWAEEAITTWTDNGVLSGYYVNGLQVPADDNTESFVINGFSSLWKTDSGNWAYSVHKLYSETNLTFDQARLGFIQGISKMRGLTIELYGAGKTADRMETTIKESTLVDTMTVNGENTKITRYDFALATDEVRPDVNEITFPTKNVDPNLKVGDIALYWFDGSEWHLQQAVAVQGS